jgi:hypothetical protein
MFAPFKAIGRGLAKLWNGYQSLHYLVRALVCLIIWWGWIPFILFLFWQIWLDWLMSGMGEWHLEWNQWIQSWFLTNSPILWLMIAIGGIGTIVISIYFLSQEKEAEPATAPEPYSDTWYQNRYRPDPTVRQKVKANLTPHRSHHKFVFVSLVIFTVIGTLLTLGGGTQWWRTMYQNDESVAAYYNGQTTVVVPSLHNPPQSISLLFSGNATSSGRCKLLGPAGDNEPVCITQGTLPMSGWQPRIASLYAANIVLSRTSGLESGVQIDTDTETYLNAWHGQPAQWSGIINGSGRSRGINGVAEWDGVSPKPTACYFSGQDTINRAIGGSRANSLEHLLNTVYPVFNFNMTDAWGYCPNGPSGQPVIVFPVTRLINWTKGTVRTAAGIVVMTGSPSGAPHFVYHANVAAGTYPGPVYPASLTAVQRSEFNWAGGRKDKNNYSFGYEPTNAGFQQGNVSEYLLESATSHRIQWVTPLTPNGSTSDNFVTYAVTPADSVSAGHLNPLYVYVLPNNDPRIVNIDTLEAQAKYFIINQDPGFGSNGGQMEEFTPVGHTYFRAYGELNGRIKYQLDISSVGSNPVTLVNLDNGTVYHGPLSGSGSSSSNPGTGPSTGGNATSCGAPVSQQSSQTLLRCAQAELAELANRGKAAPSPTPSGK